MSVMPMAPEISRVKVSRTPFENQAGIPTSKIQA